MGVAPGVELKPFLLQSDKCIFRGARMFLKRLILSLLIN